MKVTISKFGALEKKTEIDLKPLTVFIGPNNTGKTWAASIICSFFGTGGFYTLRDYYFSKNQTNFKIIDEIYSELKEKGSTIIDFDSIFKDYCDIYYHCLSIASKEWLADFLGTTQSLFENTKIEVDISEDKSKFGEYINNLKYHLSFPHGDVTGILEYRKEKGDTKLFIFVSEDRRLTELPEEEIKKSLYSRVFQPVHRFIYDDTYYLVAERTGIVSFIDGFSLTLKERTSKSIQDDNNEPRQSNPFPLRRLVEDLLKLKRADYVENVEKKYSDSVFYHLSTYLEQYVMQGKLTHKTDESKIAEKWYYNFEDALDIDLALSASSSTVKNITPLSYYLKYRAGVGQLLLIDEPEMNLHPSAQVKLIEFITILIDSGLNVIVTTHSPYLVDHLSNLMKAYEKNKNQCCDAKVKNIKDLFYLKNPKSFIDRSNVNVLLFSDNTAQSILMDDGTIDWGSFSKTTNEILDISDSLEDY